jgi:hypothetical protein
MTLIIDVSEELESKIEAEAKRKGMSKDEFVRLTLEEKVNLKPQNSAIKPPFKSRIIATNLPVKDRSREYEWLAKNRDEYDGLWVALDGERLLSSGEKLKDVANEAERLGVKDALMIHVEGSNRPPELGGIW